MGSTALVLGLVIAVLAGWSGWLALARVSLYEVSEAARLEAEKVYPVASPVTGRVVSASLVLSREVREGEVLVEIEADRERLETEAGRAHMLEAQKKLAAADAARRQAQEQAEWTRQLVERQLVPKADLARARYEAEMRRADAEAAGFAVERVSSLVAGREREAERRRIRAPIGGRLGDVIPMQAGAIVREGDRLASVIPEGHVHVVAEFPPTALGRVRAGQSARLRLEGFPWLQYGRLPAVVTRIASEARERRIRVELALERVADLPITVQHGLPATVEVEVERVAPAILVLRGAGYLLAPAGSPPSGGGRPAEAAIPPR